jgi:hypothetical protein
MPSRALPNLRKIDSALRCYRRLSRCPPYFATDRSFTTTDTCVKRSRNSRLSGARRSGPTIHQLELAPPGGKLPRLPDLRHARHGCPTHTAREGASQDVRDRTHRSLRFVLEELARFAKVGTFSMVEEAPLVRIGRHLAEERPEGVVRMKRPTSIWTCMVCTHGDCGNA